MIHVTVIPISVDPSRLVPDNNKAIMFFVEACPDGWSEYTALRGRYTVGTPSGGDITSAVGTALSNDEDRQTGQHTHTFSGSALSAHGHNFSGSALGTHNHTFSGSGMGSHGHTQGAHNHPFRMVNNNGLGSSAYSDSVLTSSSSGSQANTRRTSDNVTIRSSTISNTTPSINSSSAGTPSGSISSDAAGTPAGTNATISAGSNGNAGSVASTNAPYVQLMPCTKD